MNFNSPFKYGAFRISSPYGDRPSLGDYHNGIDLIGLDGDITVTAIMGGRVVQSRMVTSHANRTWEWGNYIAILQDDGVTAYYCHLDSRRVKQGDRVEAGDEIGIMGNTGYSLGAHLHFEVRRNNKAFNPAEYLGIPNESGAIVDIPSMPEPSYEEVVVSKCGLEKQTRDYINKYKYAADLWRKLYEQMV